ncbi:MAG: hypothetical protein GY722_09825, partial [bacterium]|nr:hypothetical protein [bacterium]
GADSFRYDLLGRLTYADVHDGWLQDFVYDAFGNLTSVETTPPESVPTLQDLPVTAETNRLTGHGYDASGNLTSFSGVWTQVYDPLNMAILRNPAPDASQWAAIYTAADERLATWDLASGEVQQHWTLRSPSGQILRDFHYGPSGIGELIFCDGFESGDTTGWSITSGVTGERSGPSGSASCLGDPEWSVRTSYAYRGAALIADYKAGDVRHYHLDHLGSVRQITNGERDVVASYDYLPYGQEVNSRYNPLQFTGHERDSHLAGVADDLDYMHARYYSPHLSRFTSVDPVLGDPAMPQSWNRFAYANNTPLVLVDPDGKNAVVNCDSESRCNVQVAAQIVVQAGDDVQQAAAEAFRDAAVAYWGGQSIVAPTGETLTFSLDISIVNQGAEAEGLDTLVVQTGAGRSSVDMTLDFGGGALASDTGTVFTEDATGNPSGMSGVAAHEAGHLMGLKDLYVKGGTVPYNPSPEGDVMRYAQPTNGANSAWWVLHQLNGNTKVHRAP